MQAVRFGCLFYCRRARRPARHPFRHIPPKGCDARRSASLLSGFGKIHPEIQEVFSS
jgi:hypothetical protein